jgi:hypothetical protein
MRSQTRRVDEPRCALSETVLRACAAACILGVICSSPNARGQGRIDLTEDVGSLPDTWKELAIVGLAHCPIGSPTSNALRQLRDSEPAADALRALMARNFALRYNVWPADGPRMEVQFSGSRRCVTAGSVPTSSSSRLELFMDHGVGKIEREAQPASWCYRALITVGNSIVDDFNAVILADNEARPSHGCPEHSQKHISGRALSFPGTGYAPSMQTRE